MTPSLPSGRSPGQYCSKAISLPCLNSALLGCNAWVLLSGGHKDEQEGVFREGEGSGTPRVADTEVELRATGRERPLLEAQEVLPEGWAAHEDRRGGGTAREPTVSNEDLCPVPESFP